MHQPLIFRHLCIILLMALPAVVIRASIQPEKLVTHIELHHAAIQGNNYSKAPNAFICLDDILTDSEQNFKFEFAEIGKAAIDIRISHPIYNNVFYGRHDIPIYVEPGDTLNITMHNDDTWTYTNTDGTSVKHETMLLYDFSTQILYTKDDFYIDKQDCLFGEFISKIMQKMSRQIQRLDSIADKHSFSIKERLLASVNIKLQYAAWIFEYASYRDGELNAYGRRNKSGWRAVDRQEKEAEAIRNIDSYNFMRQIDPFDSTVIASKYLAPFIRSYERSAILNHRLYRYAGSTEEDRVRMDSAYLKSDSMIFRASQPSLFVKLALKRRKWKQCKRFEQEHFVN